MNDLDTTRELLSRQLAKSIATDPISILPVIAALQKETDEHLRDAVRQAAVSSSWSEIATALGVSKQAAHQRFKAYATGVADEMKAHQRAAKQARRDGDTAQAAQAKARRDELAPSSEPPLGRSRIRCRAHRTAGPARAPAGSGDGGGPT